MKNFKYINHDNLISNINHFKSKKICAMVKSNAYGHGLREIVKLIDEHVDMFGVVSVEEAVKVRELTELPILICSKVDDYKTCRKNKIDVMVDDENDLMDCLKKDMRQSIHLKINCGMNRFGVKSPLAMRIINDVLEYEKIKLKSIYTHFSCTDNKKITKNEEKNFQMLRSEITQNAPICFGGSGIFDYDYDFDILRLGIGMYGYGDKNLKPVLKICSYVSKVFFASKGEKIGYGTHFFAHRDTFFAIVPVGYGDGLRRNMSGKFEVFINGKKRKTTGNICMDAFFVEVDESVSIGDEVVVMADAEYMAKKSETISYEILTGFSNFRGKTKIV